MWEYGEKCLKEFINNIDSYRSTAKSTADWFKRKSYFFRCWSYATDLVVRPTDTHQFLDPTSCHSYHCKKDILYSQTFRLNRICYDNSNFDKRCNELGIWLLEKDYSKKMARKRILRARKYSRESLLKKAKPKSDQKKLTFISPIIGWGGSSFLN